MNSNIKKFLISIGFTCVLMMMRSTIQFKDLLVLVFIIFLFQTISLSESIFALELGEVSDENVTTVIFDESHLDSTSSYSLYQFDHENAMQKPLEMLSQLDFDGDFVSDFEVVVNTERFTAAYLNEIDSRGIIIMTILDENVGSTEGRILKEWVENGGSIFIATQPDYAGFGYCKVHETNLLLKKLHVYDMFHLYEFEDSYGNYQSDELYDDTPSHQLTVDNIPTNPWDIVVTDAQFSNTTFGNEMKKGIDRVLLGVSTIEVNSSEYVGAYSWNESYSVSDVTQVERLKNEAIPWLAGATVGKGKVILLGSTFPISDWPIYGTTLKFIDQYDNTRLWVNMINWLAQPSPVNSSSSTSLSTSSQSTPLGLNFVMGTTIIISLGLIHRKKKNFNNK